MALQQAYQPIDIHKPGVGAWPANIPPLTFDEARAAVKRLWRFSLGVALTMPIKETTGRRYNWDRHGVMYVNPGKGWREFVHDLSHLFWSRANPNERPHSKAHARFEAKLVREVVTRGWLDGKLKPEEKPTAAPTTDDKRAHKLALIEAGIERWEKKIASAERRLAGLRKKQRYYAKALAAPKAEPKPKAARKPPVSVYALAREHGIDIENLGEGLRMVYPGEWCSEDDDPHHGDHAAHGMGEVWAMVKEYVALKATMTEAA